MKIEQDVPAPVYNAKVGGGYKYPFGAMKVGDSVFFRGEKTGCNIDRVARNNARRWGWKFAARTVDGGLRIWRVE